MTEREKMIKGELYNSEDKELAAERARAHGLCAKYNATSEGSAKKRARILKKLLPNAGEGIYLQGGIFFDYGYNFRVGKNFYANQNFTVLDVCPVTVGDNVFVGPNVAFLTPKHPLCWRERNPREENGAKVSEEYGAPIEIGDNCWLAGNVTVLAGAKIGAGCVIGAGSVVCGEIPPDTLAYGVPCRAVRKIEESDSLNGSGESSV